MSGRQLTLFDNRPPSFATRHGIPDPVDHRRAAALDALARELAAQRGWSHTSLKALRLGLVVLQGQHQGPGVFRASDIDNLKTLGINRAKLMRVVLNEAGLLDDDRVPAIQRWFAGQIADLPVGMRAELDVWFEIMRDGSPIPPRRRPRTHGTIRLHTTYGLPPLRQWAASGHHSLREISRNDVLAALPINGNDRTLTGAALRSIFRVLRGRKLVFVNPTARIPIGKIEAGQPFPLPSEVIKAGLHSPDPARAALTALLAFYALHKRQLRALRLTDIRDHRLRIEDRLLPIPVPVHDRLSRYLDYRAQRWPGSINPHLFINQRTAGHPDPVGPRWIRLSLQLPPRLLREDRILDEAHARPGDARRLCDLFGITVATALRYTHAIEHPDLAEPN